MAKKGYKNTRGFIIDDFPDKVEETWEYKTNKRNGLDPSTIRSGCKTKKAVFNCDICPDTHEAKPYNWFVLNQRSCRGSNYVSSDNCVSANHIDLAVQIDEAHPYNVSRGITQQTIKEGYNGIAFWKCSQYLRKSDRICNHSWHAPPSSKKENKCPACSGRVATPENNLEVCFPEVARDIACPVINPKTIPPKSSKKLFFKCPTNKHPAYEMNVFARTQGGQGCPKCFPRSSKLQLRFVSEAMYIWGENKVMINHKVNGDEVDVHILTTNIGIEFDGFRWHKDRHDKDLEKFQRSSAYLYTLLNVREAGLEKISDNDVWHEKGENDLEVVMKIFKKLIEVTDIDHDTVALINDYIAKRTFKNEKKFNELLAYLKAPSPGKSLGEKHPESLTLWDYEKNYPLTPYDVYASSGLEAYFKCPNGIHEPPQKKIYNFVKCLRSRTKGCADCHGKNGKTTRENSFGKYCENAVGWSWHSEKNGNVDPYSISRRSRKQPYYFLCDWCGEEFISTPDNRFQTKGFGCKNCHHKNGKYHQKGRDAKQILDSNKRHIL